MDGVCASIKGSSGGSSVTSILSIWYIFSYSPFSRDGQKHPKWIPFAFYQVRTVKTFLIKLYSKSTVSPLYLSPFLLIILKSDAEYIFYVTLCKEDLDI